MKKSSGELKKFDKEFKQEAVQLALSRGGPLREVAEGLGVPENLLGRCKVENAILKK